MILWMGEYKVLFSDRVHKLDMGGLHVLKCWGKVLLFLKVIQKFEPAGACYASSIRWWACKRVYQIATFLENRPATCSKRFVTDGRANG